MAEHRFRIKEINGIDFTKENKEINVIKTDIQYNLGIALMGFMNDNFYFINKIESSKGIGPVELGYVKYLHKIRNAHKNNEKVNYTYFSGPKGLIKRERVFIAGKIFPVLNITFSGDDFSPKKMVIKYLNFNELRLLFGETDYKMYSIKYISIDDDKVKIFLPKDEMGIDYTSLLLDFLTNGKKTERVATHGEFPDKETCELAKNYKFIGNNMPPCCWLTKDRETNSATWKKACEHILEHKSTGILAPFSQIRDFYKYVDDKLPKFGHNTRWTKGGYKLVDALSILDGGFTFVDNKIETILSELNLGICDYAITQFYRLFYGEYKFTPLKTEKEAYAFDLQFVTYEQGTIAPPIYSKTDSHTIEMFQNMADKDGQGNLSNPINSAHGAGGWINFVTPEFDDPWEADVTDAEFRTDLPLLMLWLDRHKPTAKSFKGKVDSNGHITGKYREIIKKYADKLIKIKK